MAFRLCFEALCRRFFYFCCLLLLFIWVAFGDLLLLVLPRLLLLLLLLWNFSLRILFLEVIFKVILELLLLLLVVGLLVVVDIVVGDVNILLFLSLPALLRSTARNLPLSILVFLCPVPFEGPFERRLTHTSCYKRTPPSQKGRIGNE